MMVHRPTRDEALAHLQQALVADWVPQVLANLVPHMPVCDVPERVMEYI